ncbi:phage uncharacterized protein (putative large terminase), C-terminal domain-containing protein [Seinonella peptonophila]|uniref:Phage uncharacterized protein (Putative large terminase), C-terminal domain-containing protein n=1 Tax=Seinonella peptonophila TaxID=112248 RepID=A0A1M4VCE3_9BACL|nr:phage terminase large subunit [Seinonella peptonophila]SHE66573.1 phage uncharacterized protein (putative large terminase), C-terminal domain-containing protein [Seinonella peptonophila]
MAWIESEKRFVKRKEREEMIQTLTEYINSVNLDQMNDEGLIELNEYLTELKRLKRIHRAEIDLLYFCWEYFGENQNPDNAGNWEGFELDSPEDAAEFHREICRDMDLVSNKKPNLKICRAAPRGHAKSTYLSKGFPIREILFRKRKYIITISITPDVASKNLEWIALQLKHNEKLRADFGELLSPKKQENPRDSSERFVAWYPISEHNQKLLTLCEAASTGQALRGRNWNGVRPDLIICDDLEDSDNTNTDELRAKLKDWFSKVVVPLGDPAGRKTGLIYMGTTVHPDCLLMDVLHRRGDFDTKVYKAIIKSPEKEDLWAQCEELYKNPDEVPQIRARQAWEFYQEHKEEMDESSEVLWADVQPLYRLYKWKWDNGSKAFSTEYQNEPIDRESMLFDPETFHYYDPDLDFKSSQFDIFMGVDFAMGKKERGDYSALVILAQNRRTQTKYVAEAIGNKLHPDQFLDLIVDKVVEWQPDRIAADANVAQEFLVWTLRQRLKAVNYPEYTRVKEVKNRTRKELRIEAMHPDIEGGKILFNKRHSLLLEQFEKYGTNGHDDLLDALEMAVSIARNGGPREIIEKPWWM